MKQFLCSVSALRIVTTFMGDRLAVDSVSDDYVSLRILAPDAIFGLVILLPACTQSMNGPNTDVSYSRCISASGSVEGLPQDMVAERKSRGA